jgi:hypothetical protein
MKPSKPSFSKIQRDFLEKFNECLKKEFDDEQLAIAARIGCDQSSISRWTNRDSAPPDYVCRLLIKELGRGSFKQSLGKRIQFLRENIFKISIRECAWVFQMENVSELEAVELGETELPRACIEMLMRDYQVTSSYLDYGEGGIFDSVAHSTENILAHLKDDFHLYIVTPPPGSEDRSLLMCRFILHHKQAYLPQCFLTSGLGSFKSTGGGQLVIEHALQALLIDTHNRLVQLPPVLMTNKKDWHDLQQSCFYQKEMHFGGGCADDECRDKLADILKLMQKDSSKSLRKKKCYALERMIQV